MLTEIEIKDLLPHTLIVEDKSQAGSSGVMCTASVHNISCVDPPVGAVALENDRRDQLAVLTACTAALDPVSS